jgi:hypothetical protein
VPPKFGGVPAIRLLLVDDDADEHACCYSELTDDQDSAGAAIVVNNHVNVLGIVMGMADKPCAWRNTITPGEQTLGFASTGIISTKAVRGSLK